MAYILCRIALKMLLLLLVFNLQTIEDGGSPPKLFAINIFLLSAIVGFIFKSLGLGDMTMLDKCIPAMNSP